MDVDGRILPSNVEDPRFAQREAETRPGWSPPGPDLSWPDFIAAVLESLPVLLERLLR
jgi:hypothetical protein